MRSGFTKISSQALNHSTLASLFIPYCIRGSTIWSPRACGGLCGKALTIQASSFYVKAYKGIQYLPGTTHSYQFLINKYLLVLKTKVLGARPFPNMRWSTAWPD